MIFWYTQKIDYNWYISSNLFLEDKFAFEILEKWINSILFDVSFIKRNFEQSWFGRGYLQGTSPRGFSFGALGFGNLYAGATAERHVVVYKRIRLFGTYQNELVLMPMSVALEARSWSEYLHFSICKSGRRSWQACRSTSWIFVFLQYAAQSRVGNLSRTWTNFNIEVAFDLWIWWWGKPKRW